MLIKAIPYLRKTIKNFNSAIDASTCMVVPSLYDYVEVFSLVVSEAWARGKPVVASMVGELPYRIKHGVNGLLVPPNNPKALAKALVEMSQCNLKPSKIELKAWHEIAQQLCLLYKSFPRKMIGKVVS